MLKGGVKAHNVPVLDDSHFNSNRPRNKRGCFFGKIISQMAIKFEIGALAAAQNATKAQRHLESWLLSGSDPEEVSSSHDLKARLMFQDNEWQF